MAKRSDDNRKILLQAAAEAFVAAQQRGYSAAFLSAAVGRARRMGWQGTYEQAMAILSEVAVVHVGRWVTFHPKKATCPMCDAERLGRKAKGSQAGPDPSEVFGL